MKLPMKIFLDGKWVDTGFALDTDTDYLVRVETSEPKTGDLAEFEKDLTDLINKYSLENLSGTPDFMLSEHMVKALLAFTDTTTKRAAWRGQPLNIFDPDPGTSALD